MVDVEFRMSTAHLEAGEVHLVGEFNEWSRTATPMQRVDDHFTVTVSLAPGRTYRYKFLVNGEEWENDWHADAYVPNEFGGNDSLLDLTQR
jgi:1,4-alpha-glucan branching enzyme